MTVDIVSRLHHTSDAPHTVPRPLLQSVPAEWLDTVLLATSEIPPDATMEERAAAILDAAAQVLPGCGVGAVIDVGGDLSTVIPRASHPPGADPRHGRLFLDLPHERVIPLGLDDRSALHLATQEPHVLHEPAIHGFADRLAIALRGALRQGRSRQIFRDQIIQSDKLASLGQIAAGVIHELNNPLTSILAYADYLHRKGERTGVEPADLERLARIHEAATRILHLSQDLRAYSRPSTDRPGPVSIHDVIDRALHFCEHVLEQASVVVTRRFGEVPPVIGVPEQLTQVFVNLFTNAAQALQTQGSMLEITTTVTAGGEVVSIEVTDDGPGVERELLARIFDPFFTTRTDGSGTGLGLNIVRSIVRTHGGQVRAEIRKPRGMLFSVDLPAAHPQDGFRARP
ncbi:sensor histidine kinase [Chondromyces apiculatus]|nr:ATP-binding protein [Chondromyces apiculatus]